MAFPHSTDGMRSQLKRTVLRVGNGLHKGPMGVASKRLPDEVFLIQGHYCS